MTTVTDAMRAAYIRNLALAVAQDPSTVSAELVREVAEFALDYAETISPSPQREEVALTTP